MIEVLFLVLILIILVVFLVIYSPVRDQIQAALFERKISMLKAQLDLTEKKFLQRKISKEVYDSLYERLESELMQYNFELFKLREGKHISVEGKVAQLLEKVGAPSNRQKSKINSLTRDSEYLKNEIKQLKGRLMKRQIKEKVYSKLVAEKELSLVQKESEIIQVIKESNSKK